MLKDVNLPIESEQATSPDIDALVQQARSHIHSYIQGQCGSMKVLDMTQSIELDNIYIRVNILERLTKLRGLGTVREERVPGLKAVETYNKLMILGKPGAGKTTFLKHLAIGCNTGSFQAQRVPIFITLQEFAEEPGKPDLLTYLNQWEKIPSLQPILQAGRSLILLDGLDEVRDRDSSRVLRDIQQLGDRFRDNQIVITCRNAAQDYLFQGFTDVEIDDFDEEQIAEFVKNWFACRKDEMKGKQLIEKIGVDKGIQELAASPLLLTLLCLASEGRDSLPSNRATLYERVIHKLLRKWNPREREKDLVYKKLSADYREKLFGEIAWRTLQTKSYFFSQRDAGKIIRQYISGLPGISPEDLLTMDSRAVLESIEVQHGLLIERTQGIYSFSHLTFHEYFVARNIDTSCNQYAADDSTLQVLVSHITKPRWREVITLTVEMLESADCLLQMMKRQIDGLLIGDQKLQAFLVWVRQRAKSVEEHYKPAAVRAFYFALDLAHAYDLAHILNHAYDLDYNLAHDYAYDYDYNLAHDHDLDYDLAHAYDLARTIARVVVLDLDLARILARDLDLTLDFTLEADHDLYLDFDPDQELTYKLRQLKEQLPDVPGANQENFKQWWQANSQTWTEQLRSVMIEHRNIGHDWQFSGAQRELLRQYYDANKLLVDCLNSECHVSPGVREEIEATLLLPIEPTQG